LLLGSTDATSTSHSADGIFGTSTSHCVGGTFTSHCTDVYDCTALKEVKCPHESLGNNGVSAKEAHWKRTLRLLFDMKNPAHLPKNKLMASTQGWSSLHMAADLGYVELVKFFMSADVDVNRDVSIGSSGTALAFAAENWGFTDDDNDSYKEIVRLMVEYEHTSIENLVISGGAVLGFQPIAADLILSKAQSRGFDPEAGIDPEKGYDPEWGDDDIDTQKLARSRYKKWLARQEATKEAERLKPEVEAKKKADAEARKSAEDKMEQQRKDALEKKLADEEAARIANEKDTPKYI